MVRSSTVMRSIVQLQAAANAMRDLGHQLGLAAAPIDRLSLALEDVQITLQIDPETGRARITHVDGHRVLRPRTGAGTMASTRAVEDASAASYPLTGPQ